MPLELAWVGGVMVAALCTFVFSLLGNDRFDQPAKPQPSIVHALPSDSAQ